MDDAGWPAFSTLLRRPRPARRQFWLSPGATIDDASTVPLTTSSRRQASMVRPYQVQQGTRRQVLCVVTVHLAIALYLGALRVAGTEAALRPVDWSGSVAMALVFALPALLGLLALRGRPAALLAAGLLSVVLAGVAAFAVLLWPPQASYSWSLTADGGVRTTRVQRCSGGTEQRIEPPGRGPGGATTVEQGCSDGVIPPGHAGVSVVVAAVALAAGLRLPRQPTPGQ